MNHPSSTSFFSGVFFLLRTFTFRPYGGNLLSPGGASWLFIVTGLVFIMALCEGAAWGRMATMVIPTLDPWSVGLVVFGIVFFLIWGFDATLMTLDMYGSLQERLYGKPYNPVTALLWTVVGYIARFGLVAGSLYLTAPQLADLVFNEDIERIIRQRNDAETGRIRTLIETRDSEREQRLRQSIDDDRKLFEEEVAGRRNGPGYGPVARSIEARIDANVEELDVLLEARRSELERFDIALEGRNPNLLSEWQADIVSASRFERRKALRELRDDENYKIVQRTIEGFLAFIFVTLFMVKVFQPQSIKIYLSAALQDEYKRFLAGEFDDWIDVSKGRMHMTPHRFEDIMLNVYPARRHAEVTRQRVAANQTQYDDVAAMLEGLKSTVEDDLARYTSEVETSRDRIQDLRQQLREAQDEASAQSARKTQGEQQLRDARGIHWTAYSDPSMRVEYIRSQTEMEEARAEAEAAGRVATLEIVRLQDALAREEESCRRLIEYREFYEAEDRQIREKLAQNRLERRNATASLREAIDQATRVVAMGPPPDPNDHYRRSQDGGWLAKLGGAITSLLASLLPSVVDDADHRDATPRSREARRL